MRQKTKDILIFVFAFGVIATIAYVIFLFFYVQNKYSEIPENIALLTESKIENDISFIEEHEVINTIFDSILNIGYCHEIIKVSENAELEYINAVRRRKFISETERDTIQKFGIVDTKSKVSYDFNHHKKLLRKELKELISKSSFFKKMKFILNDKELDSELIKKKGIELLTEETASSRGLKPRELGKRKSILNIGFVNFSRVYYSKKNNLGIFYYMYYGGQDCGYSGYVVFTKQNSDWTFKKMIYAGAF